MLKHFKPLTKREKNIVRELQGDIPLNKTPFRDIASRIHIPEAVLLESIRQMKSRGIIRRFGATLRHQRVGFRANAMSAWIVPQDRLEEMGRLISSFPEVTHCYERRPHGDWPYNLYAMIHGKDEGDCEEIARHIAEKMGVSEYVLLYSSKENKKSSMQYF